MCVRNKFLQSNLPKRITETTTSFANLHYFFEMNRVFTMSEVRNQTSSRSRAIRESTILWLGCILTAGLALPDYTIIPPRKRLAPILEKIHLDNNYIAQSAKGWMSNESLARWMGDQLIPTVNQIRGNNKDRHALIILVSP